MERYLKHFFCAGIHGNSSSRATTGACQDEAHRQLSCGEDDENTRGIVVHAIASNIHPDLTREDAARLYVGSTEISGIVVCSRVHCEPRRFRCVRGRPRLTPEHVKSAPLSHQARLHHPPACHLGSRSFVSAFPRLLRLAKSFHFFAFFFYCTILLGRCFTR